MKFDRLRFERTGNIFDDLSSIILETQGVIGDALFDLREGVHNIKIGREIGIPDMTKRGVEEIKGITNYRDEMKEYAEELIQLNYSFFEQLVALENKYNLCRREAMLLIEGINQRNKNK